MTDEQLAVLAAAGDELAFRRLRDRHRGLIYGIAARRYAPGLTAEDFVQEAQIGFWYATADYDPATAVPFCAFAQLVVTRRLDTAVKQALRLKHRPVSDAFSLDAPVPGGGPESALLGELVPSRAPSAFEVIEQRREVAAVVDAVAGMTPLERESVIGRAVGESYLATEKRLGIENSGMPKKVDNALQRARVKIADALGVDRFPLGAAA